MADQDSNNAGNGSDPSANGTEAQAATLAQYIKDLSVESPSAPQVFQWQDQPALDVQFNMNVERVSDEVHEVGMKIEVKAQSQNGVHFMIDLSYAGLFGLRNFPEEAVAPFLLIEAPRLLFPFARQIICDATQNLGFAPLLLEPVDFASAYMAQLQAGQQPGELGEAGTGTPPGDDNGQA